ncbi:CGT1 [Symbiodinium sp. CCMP2592]|nr:CGT1 [Symbiodinium sp. CCMP2592]
MGDEASLAKLDIAQLQHASMDLAKAAAQIRPLRGDDATPLLPRELELIAICNRLVHGQVVDAFPGAQPTSLTRQKIFEQLLKEPYVVCEKTDGERHLLLAHEGHVYLIDRKCRVWTCREQLPLPAGHDLSPGWHHNTLLDGELVLDAVEEGKTALRYLVYDAMHICGEDLTHRTLLYRLEKALSEVILPKEQLSALRGSTDNVQLMLKDFFELWQLGEVTAIASELPHGTDGLVFTPVMVPYVPGTVPALLKWKPAEMNTVDFKLQVIKGGDSARNMHVKLLVGFKSKDAWQVKHTGHWLAKMGDMFKKLREDPAAFDGKIAECKWNASAKTFTPSDQLKFTVNGSWEDGGWVLQRPNYYWGPWLCLVVVFAFIFESVGLPTMASQNYDSPFLDMVVLPIVWIAAFAAVFTLVSIVFGDTGEIRRSEASCYPIPDRARAMILLGSSKTEDCPNIGGLDGQSYCTRCCVWRPEGSHHCRTCQRCVTGFDHHCSFFGRCITRQNMCSFRTIIGLFFVGAAAQMITVAITNSAPARSPSPSPYATSSTVMEPTAGRYYNYN